MVIRCLNFGSLWWLRPGNQASDPLRFSARAAVFNTTGFHCGSRERRLWHVSGVVRINLASHTQTTGARNFENLSYQSPGPERRGEWNRLLLGKPVGSAVRADCLLLCARSTVIGRINFDSCWYDGSVAVIAASALRGVQETLVLAEPGAELRTASGKWEVTCNGFEMRKPS
ncbi:MAG: hypothetical protein RB191_05745 [Terriglobia bacterium]|nr:hypothetical protein [Terriglobia bacterium]